MFLILDGDFRITVNGRTALVKYRQEFRVNQNSHGV
jgi:hypothetical protein